jgi:hypothetical protein
MEEKMSTEEELSHNEISERIIAGMGLVYDLFNEMNSFFRMLVEALQASDLDLLLLKRRFILPKTRKRRFLSSADDYVKRDMGFVAQIGAGGDLDDEAIDVLEDEDIEVDKKGIQITPDSQFLAVRAILYDPEAAKTDSFKPFVVGAILSSLNQSSRGRAIKEVGDVVKKKENFQLKPAGRIYRALIQLDPTVKKGHEISWVIPKYKVSATVSGIVANPLVEFDTEEKFNEFVESLINLAEI